MAESKANKTVLVLCIQEIKEDGSEMNIEDIINAKDVEILHHAFIADTLVNLFDVPKVDFRLYYPEDDKSNKRITTIIEYLKTRLTGRKKKLLENNLKLIPGKVERWGSKIEQVFQDCFNDNYSHILLVGSRTPTLKSDRLNLALKLLQKSDAIFGPTIEGRYYLLGMSNKYQVKLSEFDWKSPMIYSEVTGKFREEELSWSEMEIWYAVEDHETLEFLIRDINQYRFEGDEESAKETEMVLQRIFNR